MGDIIYTTKTYSDILKFISATFTIIFTDLDETVLYPLTGFISGVPQCDEQLAVLERIYAGKFQRLMDELIEMYYDSETALVEGHATRDTIAEAKSHSNANIFGFTSRNLNDKYTSALFDDLDRLGVRFNEFGFEFEGFEHSRGIIFVNEQPKGPKLVEFLGEKYVPYLIEQKIIDKELRVVFIDDSAKKCKSVFESLSKASFEGVDEFKFQVVHYPKIIDLITDKDMITSLAVATEKLIE